MTLFWQGLILIGNYQDGVAIPEADYVELGEVLAVELERDLTFLHPGVFEDRGRLNSGELVLPNQVQPGRFSVCIVPGHKTTR